MNKLAIFLVALMFATGARAGEECKLTQLGSLDITTLPDGTIAVPVSIDQRKRLLIVRINNPYTSISSAFLFTGSERPKYSGWHGPMINGSPYTTTLNDFDIGDVHAKDVNVVWMEYDKFKTDEVVGFLGTDILGNFDVELDLTRNKLNLFSPNHCKGQGVYWTDTAATIPFDADPIGDIRFSAELDGKQVITSISTLPGHAIMPLAMATKVFGLDAESPGVSRTESSDKDSKTYHYVFKTLSLNGLTISNPQIDLVDERGMSAKCDGKRHGFFVCLAPPPFQLGLSELGRLRLYFAFKEKTLYVTLADAHR